MSELEQLRYHEKHIQKGDRSFLYIMLCLFLPYFRHISMSYYDRTREGHYLYSGGMNMKKKILGILLAAMVASSMQVFAAESSEDLQGDGSRQELCCGGCYGDGSGGYGYCGRGYRGSNNS